VALEDEPPPRLIVDPPLAEQLAQGRVFIQYRTENLRVVAVFGPGALDVSPHIGPLARLRRLATASATQPRIQMRALETRHHQSVALPGRDSNWLRTGIVPGTAGAVPVFQPPRPPAFDSLH
jgi:hypothetical protein